MMLTRAAFQFEGNRRANRWGHALSWWMYDGIVVNYPMPAPTAARS